MNTSANKERDSGARAEQQVAEATVAWAQGLGRNKEIVRRVEAKARRLRRQRLAVNLGAVAGLLLLGLGFYARHGVYGLGALPAASTAVVSLPERQTLVDGSVVELKAGARVTAAFAADGEGARRVVLANGEAHFSVNKNLARPFIVEVGGMEVRAVGTAFSVAFGESHVAVLVTEGRVAVERPPETEAAGDTREPVATVDAGKRLVVDLTDPAEQVPAPVSIGQGEMAAHLSWRGPRIRFANTMLSEAVMVFNRYSEVRLVLEPALNELRIGGVVRADNTDSFLFLLRTEFGIESDTAADGSLHLRRP